MTEIQDFAKLLEDLKKEGFIYNDADFCRKTGLHRSSVSEMRTGKKEVSEQTLHKIEQTFPEFFGKETDMNSSSPRSDVDRFLSIIEADHQLIREMVLKKDEEIDRLLSIMEADRGITYKKVASM